MSPRADLLRVGIVTAVGVTAPAAAAAVRAGISNVNASSLGDRRLKRLAMGLVDEDALPALAPALEAMVRRSAHRRMLRLAAPALQEATHELALDAPIPLFLGLPEAAPGLADPGAGAFLPDLVAQSGVDVDLAQSLVFPRGRAAGLLALEAALAFLQARRAPYVLVGGVDTYLDPMRLGPLDLEDRLAARNVKDGFAPGEGAAFLLLRAPGRAARRFDPPPVAQILGVAVGAEKGHLHSEEPYLGDGLSATFQALFASIAQLPPIATVYASFNGESFWGKEWGVAQMRSSARFAQALRMEHPAEYFGDPGAAAGPLMIGLAAIAMKKRYRPDPCLVFCSSDREERAAAVVRTVTS
jgi:3-oxoacyl-[acyl-carrier-protein] synthase-1